MNNNSIPIEDFFDILENSASLRLKLLSDLHSITTNVDLDISCRFHHIRSNIPTLYSQYEGFVKDIFNSIPRLLSSVDKCNKIKNIYLSLYISCSLFYQKDLKFCNHVKNIDKCVNSFFDDSKPYFCDYIIDKIKVPHEDKLYEFLKLFEFNNELISKFEVSNNKIKTYYRRRNNIIHGSIGDDNCSGFNLSDTITNDELNTYLSRWNEEYDFIKDIIALLKEEVCEWAQNKLYEYH
ncbi:hypothetical protein J0L31_11970 [Terrisporobacter glycolicus]|nr:hypothetical protein [Terrisporobacter glycolicus]